MSATFETWWEAGGQFHRAGGGQYEKTFAYHAWIDATEACARVCDGLANRDYCVDVRYAADAIRASK